MLAYPATVLVRRNWPYGDTTPDVVRDAEVAVCFHSAVLAFSFLASTLSLDE
jgi:hypothetical protein